MRRQATHLCCCAPACCHFVCTYWLQLCQQNFVANLEVLQCSIPAEDSCTAGCTLQLLVAVETENQQQIPWEVLSSGLSLSLTPPSGSEEAAAPAAGKKGGRVGGRKADIIQLSPERIWEPQSGGLEQTAAEAASAAAERGCLVCFSSPELTVAGQYTLTAEYTETRPELLPGLSKQVG